MYSYLEFKSFYSSNIILFVILFFVIVYLFINWEYVYNGNYWSGEITKSVLIAGILFLIFHMLLTWDDNQSEEELIIPKYKLGQNENPTINIGNDIENLNLNLNPNPNPNPSIQSLNSKYRIINKFDIENTQKNQEPTLGQFGRIGQNLSNTDNSKLSNKNIFVSQKNLNKYGIKLI